MSEFPDIVYKVPGPHYGADGKGFDYLGVNSAEELLSALDEGWHLTIGDAMAALDADAVIEEVAEAKEAVADVPEETREALEAKAKELGVKFNARTSDKVLAERIAAA